jgi:predicted membrane-bound spermidine synthase
MIPLLSILKTTLFPPGIMVHPLSFVLVICILLFPLCVLSGLTYAWLIQLFRNEDDDFIRVYGFEALGSMAGGICVSFIMVKWFSIMESLLFMAIVTNGLLFFLQRKMIHLIVTVLCSFLLLIFFSYPLDEKIRSLLFVNQNVIETAETYYGNLTVLENAGQYSFYEDGNLIFSSENTIISEEFVHYAMLQHKHPSQILLVSGVFLE